MPVFTCVVRYTALCETEGVVRLSLMASVGVGLGLAELPPGSGRVEVTVVVVGGPAALSGNIR